MTLLLSERDVESLLRMDDAVRSVEGAFRHESAMEATNSPRTRSRSDASVINGMHASLPYLGRSGLKCYASSRKGNRFLFILFDSSDSTPLAVMGADVLGRYRTGAASGVATKHLYGKKSARLAVCGSGRQALTQVLAVAAVAKVSEVRVWSPNSGHRESFVSRLKGLGFEASTFESPGPALERADVASTVTSSPEPFIDEEAIGEVSHLNLCGSNSPEHSEISARALGTFGTIAVDNLPQAKVEYGDLIKAVNSGAVGWERMTELKDFVGGRAAPKGRTLFKSGGIALEDVALGSLVYDKAAKSGRFADSEFDFGWSRV